MICDFLIQRSRNMRRFRALIKKEMIHMLRDPRTLVFIFLMPILQLVLLGFVNNTDIKNVPTVVFNQDNSRASRELLDSFNATGYFSFDYAVFSQAEVNDMIASGKAAVGIFLFGVPLRGSLILLFSLVGLYLLPTLGLGLLISTSARTQQQAQLMTMRIMLPSMLLSGVFFPT